MAIESLDGGASQEVLIAAGATAGIDVEPGATYRMQSTGPVHAAVALTAPGALAVLPVQPSAGVEKAIAVYTLISSRGEGPASSVLVAEVPRLTADVLRGGPEHGALDRHPAVRSVVVPRGQEPLDGQPEQHDAPILPIEVPARYRIGSVECGNRPDLEPDVLQLWPRPA